MAHCWGKEETLTLAAEAGLRRSGKEVVTRHMDGEWELLVDGEQAAAASLPELATAVRTWTAER
jgi:hypothetical protein